MVSVEINKPRPLQAIQRGYRHCEPISCHICSVHGCQRRLVLQPHYWRQQFDCCRSWLLIAWQFILAASLLGRCERIGWCMRTLHVASCSASLFSVLPNFWDKTFPAEFPALDEGAPSILGLILPSSTGPSLLPYG